MVKNLLSALSQNMVFMYGLSGSGKGEEGKVLKELAQEDKRKLSILSSGELFRATKDRLEQTSPGLRTDEENQIVTLLDNTMGKGLFVPTLHAVMPPLVEEFEKYIKAVLSGEKVSLVLDGFLRLDEYYYSNSDLNLEDKLVPSQIEQVSEAFTRALHNVLKDNWEMIEGFDREFLRELFDHQNTDYWDIKKEGVVEKITSDIILPANHTFIDITEEDVEAFMRLRVKKSFVSLEAGIKKNRKDNDGLDGTLGILEKVIHLYSGQFEVENGQIVIHEDMPDRTLDHLGPEAGDLLDGEIAKCVGEIYFSLDKTIPVNADLSKATAFLKEQAEGRLELQIEMEAVRKDDVFYRTRRKRIGEYKGTLKGIVDERLGIPVIYSEGDGIPIGIDMGSTRFSEANLSVFENGDSRGITFPILQANAKEAGIKIFQRFTALEKEANWKVERI